MKTKTSTIKLFFWALALCCGFIQMFASYSDFDTACTAYLEVSRAYLRGEFNATWSPMYPWILGLVWHILKPTPQWDIYCLYLADFLLYIFALICFEFFLTTLIKYHKKRSVESNKNGFITLPAWGLLTIGYALFIFTSLIFIGVPSQSPDMCVAGFIYLISGIIFHIAMGHVNPFIFMLLGITLGCNYLTKAAMFPMAFVFLLISVFLVRKIKYKVLCTLIVLTVFLVVSSPYIFVISKSKGYLTFGEVGKINYAICVNNLTEYWQDTYPNQNELVHPKKKIFDTPPIYEYGTPFKDASFPKIYDDSYWFEGIKIYFNLKEQIKVLLTNLIEYYREFFTLQSEFICACLLLFYLSHQSWSTTIKNIMQNYMILIPPLAALLMYSLVHVEARYIGSFVVLFWIALLLSIRLPNSNFYKRLFIGVIISIILIMSVRVFDYFFNPYSNTNNISANVKNLIKRREANINWEIANYLNQNGLMAGDKIACIMDDFGAYWARLARLKIVAQLNDIYKDSFWGAEWKVKSSIINAFAQTGAKAIVVKDIPAYAIDHALRSGWKKIGNTDHYAYFFPKT